MGLWLPFSAWAATALPGIFALAIGSNVIRGQDTQDRGCFGGWQLKVGWLLFCRNFGLAGFAMLSVQTELVPTWPQAGLFAMCLGMSVAPFLASRVAAETPPQRDQPSRSEQ
ncbi:MAG: hypothetical protein K6U09_10740 [Acidobacteriia bacterium]|nr:hypothetical protein [Terriglobia bacterium]